MTEVSGSIEGDVVKEMLKSLAVRSRFFSKCLAFAIYVMGYQDIQQELEIFVEAAKRTDRRYVRRLTLDIFFSELYYQIAVKEYFWYQFENKSDRERRTYIGETEKNILCDKIGDVKGRQTLANKYECYTYFKDFFRRDVIRVSSQDDRATFLDFLSKHRECMVKSIDQSGGSGIYRIAVDEQNADECFQGVLSSGPCVVEQCIEQTHEMAQFHPQSVNTVRIATFYDANETSILFSIFRAGTGDAVVDNTAKGGVFASIDIATGKIQSDGYLGNGRHCRTHPDTGCVFYGFQVPRWHDLLDVVAKSARAFPQHNYICWDYALTDTGWIMVEANSRGEFAGFQVFSGGIREPFMKKFRQYEQTIRDRDDTQILPSSEVSR